MLVNVVRDLLVTQVGAQDRVVQAASLSRRAFPAMWVPIIFVIPHLIRRALVVKYVSHGQLEAFVVFVFCEF